MGSDEEQQRVERIGRAAARMDRMIDDLQDLATLQAGRLSVQLRPEHPEQLLEEAIEEARGMAGQRGVALRGEVEPELPTIRADRNRISQVLSTLLTNAIRVTPPGGTVAARVGARSDGIVFLVRDQGPIAAEPAHADPLEPLLHLESTPYEGSEWGLALSKGLVEAHDGRFWFETSAEAGNAFCVLLPRMDGDEPS
jgi:signal transduction histidine kinase